MKKNIEWVKEEISDIEHKIEDELYTEDTDFRMTTRLSGMIDVLQEIKKVINQLDEPEVLSPEWIGEHRWNNRYIGRPFVYVDDLQNLLVPKQEITYEDALKVIAENIETDEFSIGLYLEALNNNEKYEFLTEKWIEDNTSPVDDEGRLYVWKRDLQNVIVPKQELPVIPKFVADFIEVRKGTDAYNLKYILCVAVERSEQEEYTKAYDWISANDEKFVRAWLDGYTVEEEPLYRARLKVITDEFIASYLCTQSSDAEDRLKALEIGSKYIHEDYRHLSEFTEDELKRLDIWDSEQWEVEGLEE